MAASIEKAWILYHLGRYEQARRECNDELAVVPDSSEAMGLAALCLASEGRIIAAKDTAERAVLAAPNYPFAHYCLSWVYYRDLRNATSPREVPEGPRGHRQWCLHRARDCILEALRLAPDRADYLGFLAFILMDLGEQEQALATTRQGLRIDPVQTDCLRVQVIVLRGREDLQAAQTASALALQANPQGASEHLLYGRALLACGQSGDALDHFREAMRLDPASESARAALLEGLRSQFRVYRLLSWLGYGWDATNVPGSHRCVRRLVLLALLMLALFFALLAAKVWLPTPGLFVLLGCIPLFIVLCGKYLFTLMLWFHSLGRHTLSDRECRYALFGCCRGLVQLGAFAGVLGATLSVLIGGTQADFLWSVPLSFLLGPMAMGFAIASYRAAGKPKPR